MSHILEAHNPAVDSEQTILGNGFWLCLGGGGAGSAPKAHAEGEILRLGGLLLWLMQRGNPTVVFSSLLPLCPALSSPTEVVEVMTVEAVRAVRAVEKLRSQEDGVRVLFCLFVFLLSYGLSQI